MNTNIIELKKGLNTAFIDATENSNLAYRPQFVYNDNEKGQKVFSAIEDELRHCDEFAISVAFITRGGITPLLQTLKELEHKGIKGRILTTDYLCFSDPSALDTLAGLSNVQLRMYQTERAGSGFHTKGYIFQKRGRISFYHRKFESDARCFDKNMEWNTKMVSTGQGEMIQDIVTEFERIWNAEECTKEYDEFIEEYRKRFEEKKLFEKMVSSKRNCEKGIGSVY